MILLDPMLVQVFGQDDDGRGIGAIDNVFVHEEESFRSKGYNINCLKTRLYHQVPILRRPQRGCDS